MQLIERDDQLERNSTDRCSQFTHKVRVDACNKISVSSSSIAITAQFHHVLLY
jgi:hypothetical protein